VRFPDESLAEAAVPVEPPKGWAGASAIYHQLTKNMWEKTSLVVKEEGGLAGQFVLFGFAMYGQTERKSFL
jgi:hypothetical protein